MSIPYEQLRHSAAHLLAHALSHLYPGTQFAIGPATKDGFFYDILPPTPIREHDLERIQAYMETLAQKDYEIQHYEVSKEKARHWFKDNPFKQDIINQIEGDTAGIAEQGDFMDVCKGGHVPSTGHIKHFALLGVSGAYWRGDKNNTALQRIHGTVFGSAKELRSFLKRREEAKKYDHRKLGKEMELFSFHEHAVGFPFFLPRGEAVRKSLIAFMDRLLHNHDYQHVSTPTLLHQDLWKRSGHYDHYHENMYFCDIDDARYAIKPMNCPGAFVMYTARPRSYRELPLKLHEMGHVHRHELSGVLHGLMRARSFTIDDTHIFCTPDQIEDQICTVLALIQRTMHAVGFSDMKLGLSTKPDNAMGGDDVWEQAINALKNGLERAEYPYALYEGEGAFYGPKIEVSVCDSLEREWQCGTIQVDFLQPENFDMTYVAPDGSKQRPVVIHHAIYGSLERFIAVLLEHHKGHLPFWMAPLQARVLPVTGDHAAYAEEVTALLKTKSVRASCDASGDPLSGKIKRAQKDRVAWMLIVGNDEVAQNTVTIRHRDGTQEKDVSHEELQARIAKEQPATTSSS